jgi:hypothetical protein
MTTDRRAEPVKATHADCVAAAQYLGWEVSELSSMEEALELVQAFARRAHEAVNEAPRAALDEAAIANAAVERCLKPDGTNKFDSAQGYACAVEAVRIVRAQAAQAGVEVPGEAAGIGGTKRQRLCTIRIEPTEVAARQIVDRWRADNAKIAEGVCPSTGKAITPDLLGITCSSRFGIEMIHVPSRTPEANGPAFEDGALREAIEAVHEAMRNGGDGETGDYGWSITKLNKARPLIRRAYALCAALSPDTHAQGAGE